MGTVWANAKKRVAGVVVAEYHFVIAERVALNVVEYFPLGLFLAVELQLVLVHNDVIIS